MKEEERYVAIPGFLCILFVLWLWMKLWYQNKVIPFFDIGMFCALVTLIYIIYPLLNYWGNGLRFDILSDHRLRQYDPSPYEIGIFHLRHVIYLFSFVIVYHFFHRKGEIFYGNVENPKHSNYQFIILSFVFLTAFFFVLQLITGFNYNSSYDSESQAKNMDAYSKFPIILTQVINKLWNILYVFKLALVLIVVSRCQEKKWLIGLFFWIVLEILMALIIKGPRTGLVLFLLAAALFFHRMVKPLSMRFIVGGSALLLSFVIFLGFYRAFQDLVALQSNFETTGGGVLSGNNEFQALLGTAYDVHQMKLNGIHLPWYLYINDFINILPPRQFLPFEKVPAAEWYLREIGLGGTGIGYMWGVIAQSIVGLDWIELVLRGGVLGFILARIHKWYLEHQSEFLSTLFYVYLCLKVYYTYRDTTFSLLVNFVWEIVPFYLLYRYGTAFLTRFGKNV